MTFGRHTEHMAQEEMLWRDAIRRPYWDPVDAWAGLRDALAARRLGTWTLKEYGTSRGVWAAWDPQYEWEPATGQAIARGWLGASRHQVTVSELIEVGWSPSAFDYTFDPLDAWETVSGWAPAGPPSLRTWAGYEMRDGLMHTLAVRMGWVGGQQDALTRGLRDAYLAGLGIALPVGPSTLGWAMAKPKKAC